MPHLNTIAIWLWASGTAGTVLLAGMMLITGHLRRWPYVFGYLSLISCQSLFCAAARWLHSDFYYFWGYWFIESLIDLSILCMVVQIGLRVVGVTEWLRDLITCGVPTIAALAFLGTLWICFQDPIPSYQRVVYIIQHVEISIDIATCVTATALVWVTRGAGVQWSGGVRGVTSGLLLEVLTSEICDFLYLRCQVAAINAVKSASFMVTLAIWGVSVVRWYRSQRRVRFPVSESCAQFS